MQEQRHATTIKVLGIAVLVAICTASASAQEAKKPLKVFLLAGQSNMDGHARISSFDHLGMDPATAPLLAEMRGADGAPTVCDEVWISYYRGPGEGSEGIGKLTAGFGSREKPAEPGDKIGPEFTFGIYMHKALGEPILLIKTAWGGKSLHTDFRPPSAGPYEFKPQELAALEKKGADIEQVRAVRAAASGAYYRLMVEHVRRVLADPGRVCPAYDERQGYELAGFVWFQGWNDMVDGGVYPKRAEPGGYDLYSDLMAQFIRDVRRDLAAPDMHFVIGVLGVGGPVDNYGPEAQRYKSTHDGFRKAMAAPASLPEFRGNVTTVLTENYWDPELDVVAEKNAKVGQKARELQEQNNGYPGQEGSIGPDAQKEIVAQFRAGLMTPRDERLLAGITNGAYHYLGSAKIMAQIGKAFAEAMTAALAR
ncbi:MAG TPA: sialate O-acetylesterase [Planctomycetota bacterium]